MIQWLNLTWLWPALGSALAALILLLYMLKLRRRAVKVPSLKLWQSVLEDRQANTPWQRIRRNWLMLLQLLILIVIILALVRPALMRRNITSGSVIVLLDASASMGAEDVINSKNRFEAGLSGVESLIQGLADGAEMTLIQVSQPVQLLATHERSRTALSEALRRAELTQGPADWPGALAIAAAAAADNNQDISVLIVSDGGLSGELPPLPVETRYMALGSSDNNLAIAALALGTNAAGETELYAAVHNYGSQERRAILSITLPNAERLHSQTLNVAAGQRAEMTLSGLPPQAVYFKAELSPASGENTLDDLAADNVAFVVNPQAERQRVYLATRDNLERGVENLFLERLLWAFGYVVTRPVSSSGVNLLPNLPATDSSGQPFDLYVLDGVYPTNAGALPAGNLLLINPPAGNALLEIAAGSVFTLTAGMPQPVEITTHPLTAFIDWQPVYVARSKDLALPDWALPLVNYYPPGDPVRRPLIFAGTTQGRRVAVIGFDLHDSNLGRESTYPILMANLLDFLLPSVNLDFSQQQLNRAAQDGLPSIQPGEPVNIRLPTGADLQQEIIVVTPNEQVYRFQPSLGSDNAVRFENTQELGVYAVNYLGATTNLTSTAPTTVEYFAVNLLDPIEAAIAPQPSLKLNLNGNSEISAAEKDVLSAYEIWPWLISAALGLLLLEWLAYHKRRS